jgi:hypothetical protein
MFLISLEQTISAARSKDESGALPAEIAGSNPAGDAKMSVSCEGHAFSGRSLCDGPIHRPEVSYRDP